MSRGLIALLYAAAWVTTCLGNHSVHYDTIVVGAGAAGSTAAAKLCTAGRRVLLVEAQERVGGRVWTQDFGDGVVEVGAEWIHGTVDNRIYELAEQNHVDVKYQELELELLQSDGSRASAVETELVNKGMELGFESVGKGQSLGDLVTTQFLAYIRSNHPGLDPDVTLQRRVLNYVEMAVNSYEASSSWLEVNAESEYETLGGHQHASWHRHGYRTLFDILLNKFNNGTGLPTLDLKLNTEVTSIEWSDTSNKSVVVNCGDKKYTADNVIVTPSLGVFKERSSSLFTPALPSEKQRAIETIAMGSIGKIILSFDRPWWDRNKMYGLIWTKEDAEAVPADQHWVTTLAGISAPLGSSNTLTLWTWGNASRLVETLPEEQVKAQVMTVLRRFMSGTANITIPEPTGILTTKWFSNPFTRGTYTFDSMSLTNLPAARSILTQPLTDIAGTPRVLFAGEATHSTRYGTVHGASETGYREAMRILGRKS